MLTGGMLVVGDDQSDILILPETLTLRIYSILEPSHRCWDGNVASDN